MGFFVGIDQGTSGTTALVLDEDLQLSSQVSHPVMSRHTPDGGIEQNPFVVLSSVVEAYRQATNGLGGRVDVAGFAHQGETVLAWDANTLEPLTPAIVWSDQRPESVARKIHKLGRARRVLELSGMRLDSYFCAAKYRWLVERHPELPRPGLRLGTLESWILRRLGASEATDIGTASRTQLTRLGDSEWDPDLLDVFGLSEDWLVPIELTSADRGLLTDPSWASPIPLRAVLVDQPAALYGNGCLGPGDMKVTFGTGAFVVANAGSIRPTPRDEVIVSVGWDVGEGPVFTIDGGVLSVGSALSWLAGLGIDVSPEAHRRLIDRKPSHIVVDPALSGSGSPHWVRDATGVIAGITQSTTGDDILQAFLDSFAYRVREIVEAVVGAGIPGPSTLRVDGGLTRSDYLMKRQASVLGVPVALAENDEATALGAALIAAGVAPDSPRLARIFEPTDTDESDAAYQKWVSRTR